MANSWLRLYAEFATDPKVQMMSEAYQRRYIMLLCLRCCNGGVTLHETEVAFQLRISDEEWAETKAVFLRKNLITDDNNPAAWDKRQFVSDSSAARVSAYRNRKKEACNNDVTLQKRQCNDPDTDTDTDTEESIKEVGGIAKKKSTSRGTLISADWMPSPENVEHFQEKGRCIDPKISAVSAPKFNPIAFLTGNGATKQAAADYLAIRRTKKAPPTETALKELVGGATKAGVTVQYALEVCCKKNWVGYDGTWPGAKPATAEKPACAQNDPFRGAI